MNTLTLLATAIEFNSNAPSLWAIATNLGTIVAGAAAALALFGDIYTRRYGKQPLLILSIDRNDYRDTDFTFEFKNYGEAPAYILSLKASQEWTTLGKGLLTNPLTLLLDRTFNIAESIQVPLSTNNIISLLKDFYQNEQNFGKPLFLEVEVEYKSLAPVFLNRTQKECFKINVTSIFLSKNSIEMIIPIDRAMEFMKIYTAAITFNS